MGRRVCSLLRTHDFLGVQLPCLSGIWNDMDVKVNMPGEFSVYNALAALAVGQGAGPAEMEAVREGLEQVQRSRAAWSWCR